MRQILVPFLAISVLFGFIIACDDNYDHMDQDGDEMHEHHSETMQGMHSMETHMHDLQNRSNRMMDGWQHMESPAGFDDHSWSGMMNMGGHMHSMAEDMRGLMNDMDSIMTNEALMNNPGYQEHLEQMQQHMNGMMRNYEEMLKSMETLQNSMQQN